MIGRTPREGGGVYGDKDWGGRWKRGAGEGAVVAFNSIHSMVNGIPGAYVIAFLD